MNRTKRLVCGLFSLMLVLCLAACGQSASDEGLAGTWQREVVFLPYYKTKVDLVLQLNEDGTYEKTVTDHEDHGVLDREEGTWTFDGEKLNCVRKNESAAVSYSYDSQSNTLENAGYQYKKIS